MIRIIDYGMGNLRSVQKGLARVGAEAQVTADVREIGDSAKLILPGIGAACDAMRHLNELGMVEPILRHVEAGRPLLGICLGMQLLFDVSLEDGEHTCLGVLPGRVLRFDPEDCSLKVPHMGWNALRFERPGCPLFEGLESGCSVYFVHSYYAAPADASDVAATADYGGPFCAAVWRGQVFGTQFHPEKSQAVGLQMLRGFAAL